MVDRALCKRFTDDRGCSGCSGLSKSWLDEVADVAIHDQNPNEFRLPTTFIRDAPHNSYSYSNTLVRLTLPNSKRTFF